ncbi:hypothetical protein [Bacillus sp. SA1-12]|uniref:hypothetical protein n=1 Tax=Bacillus sp. SA1-12 TaxID=1455638 RepID=UPI000AC5EEAF|nr:hypothetical protein [Bacillus sp. SA1-12]
MFQNIDVSVLKYHFSLMRVVERENQGTNIGNERGISLTKNLLSSRSMGGYPPSL